MTLIEIFGADNLDTGNPITSIQDRWKHSDAADSDVTLSTVTPFDRGNSVHVGSTSGIRYYLANNFGPTNIASGIVGFHFRTSDVTKVGLNWPFNIWGTGTLPELVIRPDPDFKGALSLYNGNILLATSEQVLQNDTWYHIELQYYINNSIPTNSVQLNVDGYNWITLDAGTDTQWSSSTSILFFSWEGNSDADRYVDDIYFVTLTGTQPNSFLGPSLIHTVFPTGDGNTINFIGNDGNQINNYQQVDEALPDEDTTYNSIASDGRDQYNFSHLSGTVTQVHGVELCSRARTNQSSPTRGWTNFAYVSGINYDQPSGNLTGLSYSYFSDVLGRNPNTNGEWTQSAVQDAQFGVKYTT